MKLEAPSSNIQRSLKLQVPSLRARLFEVWWLKFLWSLDVGTWSI